MTKEQFDCTPWRKSSHSGSGGQECVEVAALAGWRKERVIAMRDSKDPGGPVLSFSPAEWSLFLGSLKYDAFRRA
jgi:hypothetical protein